MMAAELIQEARTAGVTLTSLPDGRLQATGRPQVPSELKARLSTHKAEVVALLQACDVLTDLYRRYWTLSETEEPMATFQSLHQEIDRIENQVGADTAWRTLEVEARRWYQEKSRCPFCGKDELHLTEGSR
ncbi:MAG: hypothetical protein KGL31_06635 [candidate division NC10 bacterium]|nr:hypothetical protein [candidate division NC10 bacterium]MDE2321580.1 hypothetical protein [candidate division NC10 bacterium]